MTADPYKTLGVPRDATDTQIRNAYRRMAKTHHPDLNPGNKAAEETFKTVAAANDLLSDPEKRAQFDRGEIDAEGQPKADRRFYRGYAEGEQGARYRRGGPDPADDPAFAEIFSELFRGQGGAKGEARRMRGGDQHFTLAVTLAEAVLGASRRLSLPDGRVLDVTIPPGLDDGQTLRLRGQGDAGWNGGPAGDALIEVTIRPHPYFQRDGDNIRLELPVTVAEAVLGARVAVPTLAGSVTMTIPRHSDSGTKLRLRGRGVPARNDRPAGDLYVTLKLVIGTADEPLETALREWAERHPADPRENMTEAA